MKNQRHAKRDIQVRRLTLADQPELLTLLENQQLAASAGLQLTSDPRVQKWALENWLEQAELYGIWKEQSLIGIVAIFPREKNGEIGYFIQPVFRNQHIMTAAVKTVLQQTEYYLLKAEVRLGNVASQHVLTTNGFQLQKHSSKFVQYSWQRK